MSTFTFDYDLFSDLYKEAHGVRPHCHRFYDEETTDEERQQFWDWAIRDLDTAIQEEQEWDKNSRIEFEARVSMVQDTGSVDRATAIRWIIEGEGLVGEDASYTCYCLNIPYDYEAEIIPVQEDLLKLVNAEEDLALFQMEEYV